MSYDNAFFHPVITPECEAESEKAWREVRPTLPWWQRNQSTRLLYDSAFMLGAIYQDRANCKRQESVPLSVVNYFQQRAAAIVAEWDGVSTGELIVALCKELES